MIFLVRHGETDYNRLGKIQGQIDTQLNKNGIEQAYILKEKLKNINFKYVYSSDLKRAFDTATIIAENKKIIKDKRLREVNLGSWQGRTYEELRLNEPEYINFFENPQKYTGSICESYQSVENRIDDFLESLDTFNNILVITHGFILYHYFLRDIKNKNPIKNCELFLYDLKKRKIVDNRLDY